jgi:urea transport system substrate-binding protein
MSSIKKTLVSRRSLLKLAGTAAGGLLLSACAPAAAPAPKPAESSAAEAKPTDAPAAAAADTIKVGVLHSLSGTMSISEVSVKDSTLLAIEEINAAGGVMGKQLVPTIEDGASDWPTFAEKSKKLIQQDQVIVPGIDYLLEQGKKNIYLLGSDYVFPRTANKIIKLQLEAKGGTMAGEEYVQLGGTEFSTIIAKIKEAKPDAIFNTLNGDSNVAFFKQFKDAGFTADSLITMSVSVAEEEVRGIGADYLAGHLTAWNYYQTTNTPANEKFVAAYKAKYGKDRVTADPIEAGYFGVYLWKAAVEKAGSTDIAKIKEAVKSNEITFDAPEGKVKIDGETQHTYKYVRIGKVRADGLIDAVYESKDPLKPDPFLKQYDWAKSLS